GTVCVVGKMRDLILQLSKSSIYSTKPHRSQIPRIGVVCETFSSCISLVAQSDFISILPQELGCDPLLAHRLIMLPVVETLPKAAYYLIQRRDSRQTPLAESLITQFRREARKLI
ncbi:LysR substrate-binding domain-containing protein, partial [Enterobacter hormaechei]|uniref:LysR substrate-binding domain-containing protein n=1 Tax=Enterobacter hormaechei TaxID=158836 RepID=UPI001F250165